MDMPSGTRMHRTGLRGSGGYSLIEMTIAIAIAVVIGMGLYTIINSQQRTSRSQKTYNDLQTISTFAMDTLKNDLMLAGYQTKSSTVPPRPVTAADTTTVTFDFLDDNAPAITNNDDTNPGNWSNHTRLTYTCDSGLKELKKTVTRWNTSTLSYEVPNKWGPGNKNVLTLAEHVTMTLEYLKDNNERLATPVSAANLPLIRAIRVSLRFESGQDNAIYTAIGPEAAAAKKQVLALTAVVRPRNFSVADNPEDKTPPAIPLTTPGATFQAWDEGQCGCLKLSWTSNADSDIGGYTIFYGTSSTIYTDNVRTPHQVGAKQTYTLSNLPVTGLPYFIALKAYDKSGNSSDLSAEFSGDPATSIRVETDAAQDTAIDPLPPPAPGSLYIATPAHNQIQINWTKTYTDCMTSPVFGYRIYRGDSASFAPDGASAGVGNCIADESSLRADATSFLDTGMYTPSGTLVGCYPYHYKIAVVNCDTTQLTNFTNGGPTTYTAAQFASISGTPTDGTAPGASTGTPILTSLAGYRRIILSVTNPSRAAGQDPDFDLTRIYFSTSGTPVFTDIRDSSGYNVVNNGTLIPDGGGIVTTGGGPNTINFDDEDSEIPNGTPAGIGNPQLNKDSTYYFLAVSYDRCKNHAVITDQAKSTADQCGDCLSGVCRDAPPAVTNVRVTQGCDGSPLRFEWDYPDSNYTSHPDFQGFRVVRCEGETCIPSDPITGGTGTVLGTTYLAPDKFILDDSVVDGRVYNYRIYAGDCYYQRWLEGLLSAADIDANDPDNNAATTNFYGVSLGTFDRARVVGGDSETYLTADLDEDTTTIPVVSTTGWTRLKLQINSEIIACTGLTLTSFTGCTRGVDATFAIDHYAGSPVRSFPPAPARAAVTGDLALVPPTFLHNSVIVGARNSSAKSLSITSIAGAWENTSAWLESLMYNSLSPAAFQDTGNPLTHGATGSTITLSTPIAVAAAASDVPVKLNFLKSDGTVDTTVDMRDKPIKLDWNYTNTATGIATCSRRWWPPDPAGVVAPLGPIIGGTTQSSPTYGTVSWPVPGSTGNLTNAVQTPSGSRPAIFTNVHDTSGAGIASVRLYYADTAATILAAPSVMGAYSLCTPYTMVEMTQVAGTELWYSAIPKTATLPGTFDGRNVWFFIVAVDNEGNFDREPEADQGAFQYFQKQADNCLNTPKAPKLDQSSVSGNVVTLDWSDSWTGTPATYYNTDDTPCTDLGGFNVSYQRAGLGWNVVSGSPFSSATKIYAQTFTPRSTTLSAALGTTPLTGATITVASTTNFAAAPGKIKIDSEVISYTGITATSFTGCTRAQNSTTVATHALNAAVTQDVLALEANSFQVTAFDTCPASGDGPKVSLSSIYTEGVCSPACNFSVSPTSIVPGAAGQLGGSFTIRIEACEKAGNGDLDTIYVHTCSSEEGDDAPLTETADDGVFTGTIATRTLTGGGGGQLELYVATNDTITVGGYASTINSWGDINACSGKSYSCGTAQTVTVAPIPPDPCAGDHTPTAPGSVTAAKVGSCSSESVAPNNTNKLTLTWNKVTPPSGCTSFIYKAYSCSTAGCTPVTTSPVTGFTATCGATTCTSNEITMPGNLKSNPYRFTVAAECTIDNCTSAPNPRAWLSPMSSPVTDDPCP